MSKKLILSCAVAGRMISSVVASPGALDPTFGGSGKILTSFGAPGSANGVAIQGDGKVVVAGGTADDAVVVRYNIDGSLDNGFNGSGKLIGKFGSRVRRNSFSSVAVQGNGKVVAAGTATLGFPPDNGPPFQDFFTIIRRNEDGSSDSHSFHGQAEVDNICESMEIQSDGKLVLAGFVTDGRSAPADFEAVRFNPDFSSDASFTSGGAGDGVVVTDFTTDVPFNNDDDKAYSIALQPDGKIVVGGYTSHLDPNAGRGWKIALARYAINGALDPTFNGTGKVTTTVFFQNDKAFSVDVQSDGKIVVAGTSTDTFGISRIAIVRYNPNGSLDPSFNNSGIVLSTIGTSASASDMALQPDGRIVVVGTSDNDFFVARYYGNGVLEGSVTTDFGSSSVDEAHAVAVQSDGKILVAGKSGDTFAVARYLAGDPAVPFGEIVIEQPAGVNLDTGTAVADFGPVVAGSSNTLTFTIRNEGNGNLTPLTATKAATGTPGDFAVGALDTTVAPSASTTFTVTFTPSAAGTRMATLQIASNDANENPFVINLKGTHATALETWRQLHFGSPYNTGAGADLNDAEKDGLVNLVEFATASDPQAATGSVGTLVKNGSTLEFTYIRPKAAVGEVSYVREFSDTLAGTWSPVGGMVETILSDDGVFQQVRVNTPAGSGKRFVRLRVTRLP